MAILEGDVHNFHTLLRAAENGDLSLMECKNGAGEYVAVICATTFDGKEYQFVPFAKLFAGNPYEEVIPPM